MRGEGRECPVGSLPPPLAGLFFTNVSFVSSQTWWPFGGWGVGTFGKPQMPGPHHGESGFIGMDATWTSQSSSGDSDL